MTITPAALEHSPQLKRLLDHVERRKLHCGSGFDNPREWLVNWLSTPFNDLNGREPACYLENEDFDLILVGLLAHLTPETASTQRPSQEGQAVVLAPSYPATALRNWH